jgi:hypothetical protein
MREITKEEISAYIQEFPKRADRIMGFLLKNKDIMRAVESPLGNEIMKYLITEHEELLDKITILAATDEEKVRFKVIRDIIWRIADKVNTYNRQVNKIKSMEE